MKEIWTKEEVVYAVMRAVAVGFLVGYFVGGCNLYLTGMLG